MAQDKVELGVYRKFINLIYDILNDDVYDKLFIKYTSFLVAVIFAAIVLFVYDKYPNFIHDNSKILFYMSLVLIPLYFGISGASFDVDGIPTETKYIFYILIAIFCYMMASTYINISNYQLELAQYVSTILIIVAIVVGLTIVYRIFSNYLRSLDGTLGFISYFVFYIPCMISDFIKYISKEFKTTTHDVYILFILELIIILLIIYYPVIIKAIFDRNEEISLLHEPVFLNNKKSIYNMEDLKRESIYINNELKKNKGINKNYSISFWVFTNPMPNFNTNKEYSIFSFDEKPELKFKYNTIKNDSNDNSVILTGNESPYIYRAYLSNMPNTNGDLEFVDLDAPLQRWNNVVFNYTGKNVDIFMNGELQETRVLEQLPTFSDYDIINIGEDSGISGSICNIKYSPYNMTRRQIVQTYNVYSTQNPPLI